MFHSIACIFAASKKLGCLDPVKRRLLVRRNINPCAHPSQFVIVDSRVDHNNLTGTVPSFNALGDLEYV